MRGAVFTEILITITTIKQKLNAQLWAMEVPEEKSKYRFLKATLLKTHSFWDVMTYRLG
jgi:hypothetical protein